MEERVIKSVEKGWGDNSIYFTTAQKVSIDYRVDEIKEEAKQVSNDLIFNVFRGYRDRKLVFEMGASIDVTIRYDA